MYTHFNEYLCLEITRVYTDIAKKYPMINIGWNEQVWQIYGERKDNRKRDRERFEQPDLSIH